MPLVDVANILLLLTFLWALLHPSILDPFQVDPYNAWTIHCYAFGISVLVINAFVRRPLWRATPFDYLLCAYLAIVGITSFMSLDRHTSVLAIRAVGAQIAVFAAVRVLAERQPGSARLVVAALVVGIGLLEWTAADTHLKMGLSVRLTEIPPLDWDGREGLGLAAAIQCGLLIGVWQGARQRLVQFAAAVLTAGALVELLFLYSRLAWVATAAVLVAALLSSVGRAEFRRSLVALALLAAVVAALGTPYMAHLAKSAAGIEQGSESGLGFRLAAWLDATAMIRRHPLAGTGLGNYMTVRPRTDLPRSPFLPADVPTPIHPHNIYLEQMAEVGIIGGAAYTAMWAAALIAGWRSRAQDEQDPGVHLSLFLGLVAVAVSNLGEDMFFGSERRRLESIAWMMAAFVVAAWTERSTRTAARASHVA